MFAGYRRQRCNKHEVMENEEKLEESSVTGSLRFSMGRRQDESEEETWRTEL